MFMKEVAGQSCIRDCVTRNTFNKKHFLKDSFDLVFLNDGI